MKAYNGYTTVEQSKNLEEILPIESADMYYTARMYGERMNIIWTDWNVNLDFDAHIRDRHEYTVPCWSLAALLGVLPEGIVLLHDKNGLGYKCIKDVDTKWHKNPVDACVEMIIKLHELNLLVL